MGYQKLLAVTGAFAVALCAACQRDDSNSAPGSGGTSDSNYNTNNNHVTGTGTGTGSGSSSQVQPSKTPEQYDANNTGRNQRDRSSDALTSEDQGGTEADRELTRQIRRALTSNDQLSTDAKNVKIITTNGKVTLRGPVESAQEQETVGSVAKGVTGVTAVDNKLEVKQNK